MPKMYIQYTEANNELPSSCDQPELLSDWDDLDSEMRLRRFAAATQPSLLLRRFFTNLHRIQPTF